MSSSSAWRGDPQISNGRNSTRAGPFATQMQQQVSNPVIYRLKRIAAMLGRLRRLLVFGFEQLVLVRLIERHRPIAESITTALLKAKHIELPPPELVVCDGATQRDDWTHGFTAVNAALFLNLRNPDSLSRWRHARPAPAFRAIYLWDSAFIAQIWKWWAPEVGWEVLRAVIDGREGARLQHFISEFAKSPFTQPPLIAWSLSRLAEVAQPGENEPWLAHAYPVLRAYHQWLGDERRLADGLYAWAHAYESGVENAPRFGDRAERRLRDARNIAAPDLCAYMVLDCEALSVIAARLGAASEAKVYAREADELRRLTNELLWSEEHGLYLDREAGTGDFIRSRTIASLVPLWAGIPDDRRARRLADHVLDPAAFNTLLPLPSVALNDPNFERDMWRGPVWVNMAYAVIEGMRRCSFEAASADLAFRLCDGVLRTFGHTGRFYEFYDPTSHSIADLQRKRGNRWKAITLGKAPVIDFVGWTGLVNTILLEHLIGLQLTPRGPAIRPRFPPQAADFRFALNLPLWNLGVDLEVTNNGGAEGELRVGAAVRGFSARFGETVFVEEERAQPRGALA